MFYLPELPYGYDSLQPVISEITMRTHHDKHHKAYVETTNAIVTEKHLDPKTLEELIRWAKAVGDQKLFNQSSQAWNHAFFWKCMAPGGGKPSDILTAAINSGFGSFDKLKAKCVAEGISHFGSGWLWLLVEGDMLKVATTHDADTVLVSSHSPILVCDLWEHAYYLDYKNDRKDYLEAWFDRVANWFFASKQFEAAQKGRDEFRFPAPTASSLTG